MFNQNKRVLIIIRLCLLFIPSPSESSGVKGDTTVNNVDKTSTLNVGNFYFLSPAVPLGLCEYKRHEDNRQLETYFSDDF